MDLREALEIYKQIIPYRYNVAPDLVEKAQKVIKDAARNAELVPLEEVKDLIDRNEGKEPILEEKITTHHVVKADGSGGFQSNHFLAWLCPECGWFVGELYCGFGKWHIQGETSFCARCGQRIDWSKPKDEEKRRFEESKRLEREAWEKEHGQRLDNMYENLRRKHGMLSE